MYQVQVKAGDMDWSPARAVDADGTAHRLAIFVTVGEAQADIDRRDAQFESAFPDGHSARHRIVEMPR